MSCTTTKCCACNKILNTCKCMSRHHGKDNPIKIVKSEEPCSRCKEKDSNRVACVLIVDSQDRILMGRRNDNNKFSNPGGRLKIQEDPETGARRELKEETGLDARSLKLVRVGKKGNLLLYIYKVTIDPDQKIDTSKDPDNECNNWEYKDPIDIINELYVPLKDNWIIKEWAKN